tara:strand:- start:22 stop:606 length:585 start_codon:yes stop_codon:yes gene_type:complete
MFEICSARRDALDEKELRDYGRRCRHACDHCCLTKRLASEPLCREEDYGQYRMCGYIPQNGGLPLVTGYFGRRGLGYEDESELFYNPEEGKIQYSEEVFNFLPEPEEDCVQMFESKITHKPTPPPIEKSPPIPPLEPEPIKIHKAPNANVWPYAPLTYTSARTVPLGGGKAIRHISQIPKPIPKKSSSLGCIIC